jgi:hypothetical protein
VRLFGESSQTAVAAPIIDVPEGFQIPPKTQWGFTPCLQNGITQDGLSGNLLTGTSLGPHVTLHHESDGATISIQRPDDYGTGLVFEFSDFAGDYFSLAFALPDGAVSALGRQDLLRLNLRTRSDEPLKAYARLNLCHGPNTEQIVRMIDVGEGESFAEFDIFYTEFEQKRSASAWIDLIINDPAHKAIALEEVVILRRARASL